MLVELRVGNDDMGNRKILVESKKRNTDQNGKPTIFLATMAESFHDVELEVGFRNNCISLKLLCKRRMKIKPSPTPLGA